MKNISDLRLRWFVKTWGIGEHNLYQKNRFSINNIYISDKTINITLLRLMKNTACEKLLVPIIVSFLASF